MKILWNVDFFENQSLDQVYCMLEKNPDFTITVFPRKTKLEEIKVHPLYKHPRFILKKAGIDKPIKVYLMLLFLDIIASRYTVVTTLMAQTGHSFVAAIACKLSFTKYIVQMLGSERALLPKYHKWFTDIDNVRTQTMFVLKHANFHIGNDKTVLEVSKVLFDKPRFLLYNGMRLERYQNVQKEKNKKPVIFFNHRILDIRRPLMYLEALEILQKKGYKFEALFVETIRDNTKIGRDVQEFIKSHSIKSQVNWINKRLTGREMDELYRRTDICINISELIVLPSLGSLEAMLNKVPLVVTPEIDHHLYVKDGFNGLVAKANAKDVAKKIANLLDNPKKREQMGINARKHVMQNFSLYDWAAVYGDIFRHVAYKKPLPNQSSYPSCYEHDG